jgi:hypothetical protein
MKTATTARRLVSAFCLASVALITACSIPNLESPECSDAREAVRQFYSFHYANDISPSAENIKLREKYLTQQLYTQLTSAPREKDYFTNSETPPIAFRVAACRLVDPAKADLGVHLFWKDNNVSIQKEVNVEAVRAGDTWLINAVRPE